MSQAHDLAHSTADVDAITRTAEFMTDLVEDEGEAMLYTFDDDSVLVISGRQMTTFDDIHAARGSLGG